MNDPVLVLILGLVILGLAGVLLWPERGLVWKATRATRAQGRVLVEDALKHIYDCEYQGATATIHSLSGALDLSGQRAAELIARLEEMELIEIADAGYRLRAEGRSEALRVIRIHRLWERYLSEETGLDALEWHNEAERREHRTSPEQAQQLAESLGFPRFDPHGDPIPTADGEVRGERGVPLGTLAEQVHAEVVHVEDEPPAVYAQLLAVGIHPGTRLRVLERDPGRVRVEVDAQEHVLAAVLAGNVEVREVEPVKQPAERLSALPIGASALVVEISAACRGPERRRLLDLGLIPGTRIRSAMSSAGGDPVAYEVRGGLLALRREQADLILIDSDGNGSAPTRGDAEEVSA